MLLHNIGWTGKHHKSSTGRRSHTRSVRMLQYQIIKFSSSHIHLFDLNVLKFSVMTSETRRRSFTLKLRIFSNEFQDFFLHRLRL